MPWNSQTFSYPGIEIWDMRLNLHCSWHTLVRLYLDQKLILLRYVSTWFVKKSLPNRTEKSQSDVGSVNKCSLKLTWGEGLSDFYCHHIQIKFRWRAGDFERHTLFYLWNCTPFRKSHQMLLLMEKRKQVNLQNSRQCPVTLSFLRHRSCLKLSNTLNRLLSAEWLQWNGFQNDKLTGLLFHRFRGVWCSLNVVPTKGPISCL